MYKQKLETAFAALASFLFHWRLLSLALCLALFAATLVPLPGLRMDTAMVGLFHEEDPARVAYEEFQRSFGKDDVLVVILQPQEVFDTAFLESLSELHRALEAELPHLDRITSLVNVRSTRGEGAELIVEDLMEEVPATPQELAAFRQRVQAEPLYQDFLISSDGQATAIVMEPDALRPANPREQAAGIEGPVPTDAPEFIAMVERAQQLAEPFRARGIDIQYAGPPVLTAVLQQTMQSDMGRLGPLSFLLAAVLLGALFRRVTGVIYPLLIVLLSLLSTLGVMALLGIPITNVTAILPSFLIVVGVADAVHILTMVYREHGRLDRHDAVVAAFRHSGPPVLLTSLTTAAGLLSFVPADVAWCAQLGQAAPIGVLFALLYTVFLLPGLLALFPLRGVKTEKSRLLASDRLLLGVGRLATGRPWWVLGAWALVLAVSMAGLPGLKISQNGMRWFPVDHPIRTATQTLDQRFGGSLAFELVVDSGRGDGLYDAELMQRLDSSKDELERYEHGPISIGRVGSVSTVLKEVNRALHDNDPAHYAVPDDDRLVAQELLLFEMSGRGELEKLISADLSQARLTLAVPFVDAMIYKDVLVDLQAHCAQAFPGLQVTTTGMQVLFIDVVNNILTSMAKAYPLALLVVTLLMVFSLGRPRIGLLAMAPNLVPILVVTGWMGWLKIPFDFSTMLFGSIALGLVVDDTIHFLHGFAREHAALGDVPQALRRTLLSTGRAIFITSMTLAAGFFIYCTATLQNLLHFGLLTGCTVLVAMLADFLLVPALLELVLGRRG